MSSAPIEDEAKTALRDKAVLKSAEEAFQALASMRNAEGAKLASVLGRASRSNREARASPRATIPARRPRRYGKAGRAGRPADGNERHFRPRPAASGGGAACDQGRHPEEIDRLFAHIGAARKLIQSDQPAGRQLDFLAQEFNREANTLCSKAADRSLTAVGLELKTVIDQMREQVQNIE